jgi:hypothetical protein
VADDPYDAILSELLDSAEAGRALELQGLLARYPGHEATVRRVFSALASYRERDAGLSAAVPTMSSELKPGDRLGDFEIEGPLSRGGMGVVYRARQLSLGRRMVALKVLPADSAGVHRIARFQREALSLAGLHHPHLAEIHGFGEARGCLFFAIRLVEGPTLRDLLEQRAVARAEACDDAAARRAIVERIVEVADALAAVHVAGLVHRDVKPSNVVLEGGSAESRTGSAVLVDFGLVRAVDSRTLTRSGESPATPSYAPPEQLLGQDVDARADVFSLGVTLHDLLAARRPQERMQASVGLDPIAALVPGIDPDLAAIVSKAVDPEARWRYSGAAAMRDDLRAWLRGDPVSARQPPLGQTMKRWAARNQRRLAWTAAIALVVVVGSLAVARAWSEVSAASAARNAFERGDIAALASVAGGLRASPLALLKLDEDVEDAVRRVDAGERSDALAGVAAHLARNDVPSALLAAATELRVRGPDSDPLVARFFVSQIDGRLIGAGADTEAAWPVFAARLFYEEPVDTPEELEWSRPFHRALATAWERPDLPHIARAHLLTAFAGCGVPADVDFLLAWALESERSQEETRLGLRAVEFIIRRAHDCGTLADLDSRVFWDRALPHASNLVSDTPESTIWDLDLAFGEACRAMLIGQGAPGAPSLSLEGLVSAFRDAWPANFDNERWHGLWLELLALGVAPDLAAQALDPLHFESVRTPNWRSVGRAARFLDRRDLDAKLDEWLARHGTDACRADYAWGRHHAESLFDGKQTPDYSIDEETRLGAMQPDAALERVPVSAPYCIGSSAPKCIEDSEPEAVWRIVDGGVARDATAGEMRAAACPAGSEDSGAQIWHFLKLVEYGTSRVEIDFDVAPGTEGADRALLAQFQTSARQYYPRMGSAVVEVEVNTWPVARVDWTHVEPRWRLFVLPSKLLRPGTNTVVIRSHATSTTTLWISAAEIWRLNKRH